MSLNYIWWFKLNTAMWLNFCLVCFFLAQQNFFLENNTVLNQDSEPWIDLRWITTVGNQHSFHPRALKLFTCACLFLMKQNLDASNVLILPTLLPLPLPSYLYPSLDIRFSSSLLFTLSIPGITTTNGFCTRPKANDSPTSLTSVKWYWSTTPS